MPERLLAKVEEKLDLDAEERELFERILRDPRPLRRRGFAGWWERYRGSLAWFALLLITAFGFSQIQSFSTDLRDGLVKSCEQNGNPLRVAVAGQLRYQLEQSHSLDYSQFFPDIPPDQLHALLHEQNQRIKEELATIQPVDCETLYPK